MASDSEILCVNILNPHRGGNEYEKEINGDAHGFGYIGNR